MEHVDNQDPARGPLSVGSQLRGAREAQGKSRADIASQTKIAERHLAALEEDRLGDLAARTYAVGFARTYARAVGLNEQHIAAKVREQLDHDSGARVEYTPSFEPGDPARVPTRGLAWLAAAGVIVVVGALLLFWSNFLSPEGELPDLVAERTAAAPAPRPASPVDRPAPATGPVMLTATGDRVWVKVTDASGEQVLQKELAKGETWTAPSDGQGLQLRTGRPDALQISVGGKPLPPLSTEPRLISGVSLAAADLLGRPAASSGGPGVAPAPPPPAVAPVPERGLPPTAQRSAPRPSTSIATSSVAGEPSEVPTPESLLPPTAR